MGRQKLLERPTVTITGTLNTKRKCLTLYKGNNSKDTQSIVRVINSFVTDIIARSHYHHVCFPFKEYFDGSAKEVVQMQDDNKTTPLETKHQLLEIMEGMM